MATVQTLKNLGEQMGLKGTELRDFIKEQQDLDIEERNRLREEQDKQREHDKIQQDKLDKFRLAEMEREKEKEQRKREEQHKQRESEEKLLEYQKEKDEKDREFEIERMKFERDKMYFELQMKATEVKKASSVKSEDEEGEDNKEGSVASGHTRQRIGAKGSKMPCFDERSDDMDSFLHRFEVYADSQR